MKFFLDKPSKVILYFMILLSTMMNGDSRLVKASNSNNTIVKTTTISKNTKINYEECLIEKTIPVKHIFTERELIEIYVREISAKYNVDYKLIMSMIEQECDFNPRCKTGVCVGLMQINPKYHSNRANELGIHDLYDPYGNILVGVDYISSLIKAHKDPALALMFYNMNHKKALRMYRNGELSIYAKKVLAGTNKYK